MAEATLCAKHNRRNLHHTARLLCICHIHSVGDVGHLGFRKGQKEYHRHVKVDSKDHSHKHKRPKKDVRVLESRPGRYTSLYRKSLFCSDMNFFIYHYTSEQPKQNQKRVSVGT